jgi:hypothetical protein
MGPKGGLNPLAETFRQSDHNALVAESVAQSLCRLRYSLHFS